MQVRYEGLYDPFEVKEVQAVCNFSSGVRPELDIAPPDQHQRQSPRLVRKALLRYRQVNRANFEEANAVGMPEIGCRNFQKASEQAAAHDGALGADWIADFDVRSSGGAERSFARRLSQGI